MHPEVLSIGTKNIEHSIDFTYDVVYRTRNRITFKTRFDDLLKSKTVLEINVLLSTVLIIGLIVVIIMALNSILKRVVDQSPVRVSYTE